MKSFKKIKSENYATLADDPDYFERDGEEVYRDEGTVYEKAMTVYGEPDRIDREDMTRKFKSTIYIFNVLNDAGTSHCYETNFRGR